MAFAEGNVTWAGMARPPIACKATQSVFATMACSVVNRRSPRAGAAGVKFSISVLNTLMALFNGQPFSEPSFDARKIRALAEPYKRSSVCRSPASIRLDGAKKTDTTLKTPRCVRGVLFM
jgi:hypothetical protein